MRRLAQKDVENLQSASDYVSASSSSDHQDESRRLVSQEFGDLLSSGSFEVTCDSSLDENTDGNTELRKDLKIWPLKVI